MINSRDQDDSKPFQQQIVSFIGDVNSGKTTLIGRYLYLDENTVQNNNNKLSKDYYRNSRQEGEVEKIAISYKYIKQDNQVVTLLDAQVSYKRKIDSLMTAIWLSNICVLVIDVTVGVFEKDFNNPVGSIRTQLQMVEAVGLTKLVVCFTKCDVLSKGSELNSRLEYIAEQLNTTFKWKDVPMIPVSCINDENIMIPSYEFSQGKTLFSVLRSISIDEPKKEWIEKPLIMPIFKVHKIGGIGTVIVGKIISGKIIPDQEVYFNEEKSHPVRSIEIANQSQSEAICGQFCGINIKGVDHRSVGSHYFICDKAFMETRSKSAVESFTALIEIRDQPKNGIKVGYNFKLYYSVTNNCLCKIQDILHTVDPKTNKKLEIFPSVLRNGDFAQVRLKPLIKKQSKTCFLDTYKRNEILGRIVLMSGRKFIGTGKVETIN